MNLQDGGESHTRRAPPCGPAVEVERLACRCGEGRGRVGEGGRGVGKLELTSKSCRSTVAVRLIYVECRTIGGWGTGETWRGSRGE